MVSDVTQSTRQRQTELNERENHLNRVRQEMREEEMEVRAREH